jgi:hypothetical protein
MPNPVCGLLFGFAWKTLAKENAQMKALFLPDEKALDVKYFPLVTLCRYEGNNDNVNLGYQI